MSSLRRKFYRSFVYTHEENNERFDESGVSARKSPEDLTIAEIGQLAGAYETSSEEMFSLLECMWIEDPYGK